MIKKIFMANLGLFVIGVIICFTGLVLSPVDDHEKSRRWKACTIIAVSGLIIMIASLAM
ncbi:MAG: hypothetical protein PHH21_03145 [Candidatus Pacebacteria bacterium]|nr:hypothetical protein [Candidatus Paceibacterota bacterium]